MEITTSSIFSPKAAKALYMASLYKEKVPNKAFLKRILIGVAILGGAVVLSLPFGIENAGGFLYLVGCIIFFYFFFIFVLHFANFPFEFRKIKRPGSPDASYTLTFRDDGLRVLINEWNIETDNTYQYGSLREVVETGEYILIFVDAEKVYAVEKARIHSESAREIRERMSSALGKKYIIASY